MNNFSVFEKFMLGYVGLVYGGLLLYGIEYIMSGTFGIMMIVMSPYMTLCALVVLYYKLKNK